MSSVMMAPEQYRQLPGRRNRGADGGDLLFFLTVRNIKVRYRQTLLGGLWAILQPLLTMAMLTIVFGKLIGVPSGGVPYWIFALSGLVRAKYTSCRHSMNSSCGS